MNTLKNLSQILLVVLILLAFNYRLYAQGNTGSVKQKDSAFVNKQLADNITEINLSQIAKTKAADPELKKIAEQINADHVEILKDLKRVGQKLNIFLAEGDSLLTSKTETDHGIGEMKVLENATGKDFEKLWVANMITMHEAKFAELENASSQITDGELKAVVNKALPKIRVHLDMLKRMQYKYGK